MIMHESGAPDGQVSSSCHLPPRKQELKPTRPQPGRRIARGSIALACAIAMALAAVYLATPHTSQQAAAVPGSCENEPPWGVCAYPIALEPGPARPWQGSVSVSTYSSVSTATGNVFTAIPIVGWSGVGPDMSMMLYHNSANAVSGYSIADVVGFDLGPGWSISYSDHLRFYVGPNGPTVKVVHADGTQDVYQEWPLGTWVAPGIDDEL